MGRFPQGGNFGCFVSFKKNLCWPAVTKPDLLRHFFQLFCGEYYHMITLPQPQPPINSLHCTEMHQKCPVKSDTKQCILVYFECIVVHCSELMGG